MFEYFFYSLNTSPAVPTCAAPPLRFRHSTEYVHMANQCATGSSGIKDVKYFPKIRKKEENSTTDSALVAAAACCCCWRWREIIWNNWNIIFHFHTVCVLYRCRRRRRRCCRCRQCRPLPFVYEYHFAPHCVVQHKRNIMNNKKKEEKHRRERKNVKNPGNLEAGGKLTKWEIST